MIPQENHRGKLTNEITFYIYPVSLSVTEESTVVAEDEPAQSYRVPQDKRLFLNFNNHLTATHTGLQIYEFHTIVVFGRLP